MSETVAITHWIDAKNLRQEDRKPTEALLIPFSQDHFSKRAQKINQFEKNDVVSQQRKEIINTVMYIVKVNDFLYSRSDIITVNPQTVYWETLYEPETRAGHYVASSHRLWILNFGPLSFTKAFEQYFNTMDEMKKAAHGTILSPKKKALHAAFKEVNIPDGVATTKEEWARLIDSMNGNDACMKSLMTQNLDWNNVNNPMNPLNAFFPPRTFFMINKAKTIPGQADFRNYLRIFEEDKTNGAKMEGGRANNGFYTPFVDRQITLRNLPMSVCHPYTLQNMYLPHVQTLYLQPAITNLIDNMPELREAYALKTRIDASQYLDPTNAEIYQTACETLGYIPTDNIAVANKLELEMNLEENLKLFSTLLQNDSFLSTLRSESKVLRREHKIEWDKLMVRREGMTLSEFGEELYKFEKKAVHNFVNRIMMNDSAQMPEVAQKIIVWMHENALDKPIPTSHCKFDMTLTTFGNMVARQLLEYDLLCFISSSHAKLFAIMEGRKDAYRHEPGTMHYNSIMTGDAATGNNNFQLLFNLIYLLKI